MREYVFISDVNTDIPSEYAAAEGIPILPQYYHFNDGTIYGDEIKLTSEEFYTRLAKERSYSMGCNPDRVRGIMKTVLDEGKDIIVFMASSECSGSYATACSVAEDLGEDYPDARIHVVDSYLESAPIMLLIDKAVEMKKQGATFDEVVDCVEKMKAGCNVFFVVDDLKYLVRGGRLNAVSGAVGTMLNIKPILYFKDGLISAYDKVRGNKAAKKRIIEDLREKKIDKKIVLAYTRDRAGADELGAELQAELGLEVLATVELSLIIGTHTGPGVFGVGYCELQD